MGVMKSNAVDLSSRTVDVLLNELREECEHVAALIQRIENCPDSIQEQDKLFGELSAAVFHLHTHTAGLDEFLCETE